jgi:hypothetical protein
VIILLLILRIWPRTRVFLEHIRGDWTLLSFLIYGAGVFAGMIVFEVYAYNDAWTLLFLAVLAVGAWLYLRSQEPRKRILALLSAMTLAFWLAAAGKWYLVPLQSWGARYGYSLEMNRTLEVSSTLVQWGWVMLLMVAPSVLSLFPRPAVVEEVRAV